MESEIKIVTSVDKDKWSKFVEENPYGNVFQTPEMREVFLRTKRMEPISLFALDDKGNILSLIQSFLSKEKKGILSPVATRSVIIGGPLFSDSEQGSKSIPKLMQKYDKIVAKRAMFTEIRMLYGISEFSILQDIGYIYEDHLNFLLGLTSSEKDLWGRIHKSKRRAIKKAQNNGIEVEQIKDKEGIKVAYDLLDGTYKAVKIPLPDISLFESAFEILGPIGYSNAFLYKHKGKAIATRLILTYKDRVYDWYTGSNRESFSLYPNDFSEWHVIKWGLENGYSVFDFAGAGKPNKSYGPREFKRRFGGDLVNFGRYKKIYHPIKLNIAKVGYNVYRRFFIR